MPPVHEENMLIEQVMHDNPETLTPEHLLKDALQVYERHGVNCVPILDGTQKVRGILTVFRLLHAIREGRSFDTPIGEVMDVNLVSIRNDDTFGMACSMPIDRMLVLDHDDKLVGVLTKKELIHKIYTAFCSAHGHNRELREIINCATDGIMVFDSRGLALFHNDTLLALLPKGDSITAPQSPATNAVAKLLHKTIASQRAGSLLLEDCGGKQVFFTTTPLFDEAGTMFRCVLAAQDMTAINQLREEAESTRRKLADFQAASQKAQRVIARSPAMLRLLDEAAHLGGVDSTVLITGETGVGKEVVAMHIHSHSQRRDGPLVQINCGTIPQHLQEAELFGYEKGSFTGADASRVGMLEVANRGTLMLDEVGEMDLSLQVKLLRALQEGIIYRIGGRKPVKLNVRIIAMTNRNLRKMVQDATFREDLYYRLNVIPLALPPLRERHEDIVPLAEHFLARFNKQYATNCQIQQAEQDLLLGYPWPGNVRELANFVERLTIAHLSFNSCAPVWQSIATGAGQGVAMVPVGPLAGSCPSVPSQSVPSQAMPSQATPPQSMRDQLKDFERHCLEQALRTVPGIRAAARYLQISHATLLRKMREHGLEQ